MTQLRRYRLASGLNLSEFAKAVGVSVSAASQWESGRSIPDAGRFPTIARVLGITPLDLTQLIYPEPAGIGR